MEAVEPSYKACTTTAAAVVFRHHDLPSSRVRGRCSPDPACRVGVLAIMAFTIALLAWWVLFHLRYSAQEIRAPPSTCRLIANRERALRDLAQHQRWHRPISRVGLSPARLAPGVHPGQELVPGYPATGHHSTGRLEHLQAQRRASIRMSRPRARPFFAFCGRNRTHLRSVRPRWN